jgi:hypothetical protein
MLGIVSVVRKTLTHAEVNTPCGNKFKNSLLVFNQLMVNAVVTVF